jgi:hypothetical protein
MSNAVMIIERVALRLDQSCAQIAEEFFKGIDVPVLSAVEIPIVEAPNPYVAFVELREKPPGAKYHPRAAVLDPTYDRGLSIERAVFAHFTYAKFARGEGLSETFQLLRRSWMQAVAGQSLAFDACMETAAVLLQYS